MALNICIDIDGTITDAYYWLERANDYFGTMVTEDEVVEYEIYKVLGISRDEYLKFYYENCRELHSDQEIRQNAKKIIRELDRYHNVYYVTAREEIVQDVTENWIVKNELPEGKLYMLGSHYKVSTAKELNCHIFIEDRYENAVQLSQSGFKVLLMDTNYNKYSLDENITRVYDWNEVHREIVKFQVEAIPQFTSVSKLAVDF